MFFLNPIFANSSDFDYIIWSIEILKQSFNLIQFCNHNKEKESNCYDFQAFNFRVTPYQLFLQ